MSLELPKQPDEDIMKMLIRANQFLEHAKNHALSESEFDTMIAIHNLDNSIEYMLRIIIRHLEIEEHTGKTINTCELTQIIGEITKYLKDNNAPLLSYVAEMKMIRELRNMVQHAMINPVEDTKTYINYAEKFFEKSLTKFFGITKEQLRFSALIVNTKLKSDLQLAEQKLDSREFLESIVNSRNAFEYAKFIYSIEYNGGIWNAPALAEIKNSHNNLYMLLRDINKTLTINSLNLDMNKYLKFCEYVNCIPKEHCVDWCGNTVLQREWEKQDAEFCYSFVANAILNFQTHKLEPIQVMDTSKLPDIKFVQKMGGIIINDYFEEKGCCYFEGNKSARLFYLDSKEKVDTLISKLKNRNICVETMRYGAKEMQVHMIEQVSIQGFDAQLIINNPATWQIIVLYDEIPFATYSKNPVFKGYIDIDTEIEKIEDEKIKQLIIDALPIDSINKAVKLQKVLGEKELASLRKLYSSKWIKILENEDTTI